LHKQREVRRAAAAARNRFVACGKKQGLGSEEQKQSDLRQRHETALSLAAANQRSALKNSAESAKNPPGCHPCDALQHSTLDRSSARPWLGKVP
jgi:predicted ATPase